MKRLQRQLPFLQSVLQQPYKIKRQEMLQHANADQINAISEIALNLLKQHIPVPPTLMTQLTRHKQVLRQLSQRKASLKKRRNLLLTQPFGLFKGLYDCLCQCS